MKPVIIIEDDNDSWLLLRSMLIQIGFKAPLLHHCASIAQLEKISFNDAALVLCDLTLPDSPSDKTFETVCHAFPAAPIIVITGNDEMEMAVETIKKGAQDYLIKGEIDKRMLSKAIQYAIERKRSDNDYKQLFFQNPAAMFIFDKQTLRILAVNDAAVHQYGYTREEFLQLTVTDIRTPNTVETFIEHVAAGHHAYYDAGIWQHKRKHGSKIYVHIHAHTVNFDGKTARMIVAMNVDKAIHAERALQKKIKEVEHILESMNDAFFTVNKADHLTYVNGEFEKILHVNRQDVLGKNIWEVFPEAVALKFHSCYYRAVNEQTNVFLKNMSRLLGSGYL
jgi:PAS domain S-box-containing protein